MSLLDTLRAGIKIADSILKPFQATVTLQHLTSRDGYGPVFGNPVSLLAIVDGRQQQVRTLQGVLSMSRASVMFLDVAALMAATNSEGLNDQDIITLPDGTTGPILNFSGFVDAGTTKGVVTEVYIG